MNRVQFQPGLSIAEFIQRFGTQEQCEAALTRALAAGLRLPWVRQFIAHIISPPGTAVLAVRRVPVPVQRDQRHRLRKHQAAFDGLVLGHASADPSQAQCRRAGLMRHLGVCYRTAWLIKHKLLEVMRRREDGRQLTGRIEMDDAYLGGERRGGTVGRGSEDKVSFVAAVQITESGQPHLARFSQRAFTKESLREFMSTSIVLPATVVSDGLSCFTVAQEMGMAHDRTVTGGGPGSVEVEEHWAVNAILGSGLLRLVANQVDR